MNRYILVKGAPVPEPDFLAWAGWFEWNRAERIVAQTDIPGDVCVSTVFLGLDHNLSGAGPPLLWETMIFGGPHDGYQRRYSTRADAEAGHRNAVAFAVEVTRAK